MFLCLLFARSMARKNTKRDYDQNLLNALKKIPHVIEDKRHNLTIHFENDDARSNQSRFEHIVKQSHRLTVKDVETIDKELTKSAKLKKDKSRKGSYNYYIQRNKCSGEYIKISISIDKLDNHIAKVKTIFITKVIK